MKKATVFLLLLLSFLAAGPALADGKFYWSESIPPGIPYQRALVWFDGERETLLLQSKYDTPTAPGERFGWVVPVPAVPELASMEPSFANQWFREADSASTPKVTRVSEILLVTLLVGVHGAALLTLLVCALSFFASRPQWVRRHRATLVAGSVLVLLPLLSLLLSDLILEEIGWPLLGAPVIALLVLLACVVSRVVRPLAHRPGSRGILAVSALLSLVAFVVIGISMVMGSLAGLGRGGVAEGIEIVETAQVGIYDAQVVRADQAGDLIEWLNDNRFHFDEADQEVFDDYLRRGWCFVVAKVDPARAAEGAAASEGLVAPLILRFAADAPVYPLALTATAGQKAEILLYLFSQDKWTSDRRLELQYAGRNVSRMRDVSSLWSDEYLPTLGDVEPQGFFDGQHYALPYLCKFKGTLSTRRMRQDLVFTPAQDQEAYRKRIIVW